jgi:hypothetical protein
MVDRDVRRNRRAVPNPEAAPADESGPNSGDITETPTPGTGSPTPGTGSPTPGTESPAPASNQPAAEPPEAEKPPSRYPTEALLQHQVAAAQELRADLDRLRRQLDDGPPPLVAPRRRSRKPLLAALIIGAVIAAIITAILLLRSDHPSESGNPGSSGNSAGSATSAVPAEPSNSAGSSPGSQSTPGSAGNSAGPGKVDAGNPAGSGDNPGSADDPGPETDPGADPSPAPAPRPIPPGSLPPTGPGIDQPGTMMLVRVSTGGTLEVSEQARVSPGELPQIGLRLPSITALGGLVAELSPTVQDLRVAVNGTPVTATPSDDGWAVTPADSARTVQLSYRIEGAIVRTAPSSSGRALGVSLPLLGQSLRERGLPLVVRAEGSAVGGATCPSAPITKMLCGKESDGGWLATIPAEAASPALLLQLTLS